MEAPADQAARPLSGVLRNMGLVWRPARPSLASHASSNLRHLRSSRRVSGGGSTVRDLSAQPRRVGPCGECSVPERTTLRELLRSTYSSLLITL